MFGQMYLILFGRKKTLVCKKSFILGKFNHLSSICNKLDMSRSIFGFLRNICKKLFFSRCARALGKKRSKSVSHFVIIFAPFSVGRFVNFEISKCSPFYVKYNKKWVKVVTIFILHISAYISSKVSKFRCSVRCTLYYLVEKITCMEKVFHSGKIQSFIFNLQQTKRV